MKKQFILVALLGLIQFSHILDFIILMPMSDLLMELMNITPAQFSILVASYTVSAGTSGFLSAFYIDRFDRRKLMMVLCTGFGLGSIVCGLVDSYYYLITARLITGVFGGVISAVTMSIISDEVDNKYRARAMSIVISAFSVASVIGVPLGVKLAVSFSWGMPFVCIGSLALVAVSIFAIFTKPMTKHLEKTSKRRNPIVIVKDVFSSSRQLIALAFMFSITFSQFLVIPFIVRFMVQNVGFTYDDIPLIYLFGGGLTMICSPLIGKWADAVDRKKVYTVMALLSIGALAFLTNLQTNSLVIALLATCSFFVTISGRAVPAQTIMTTIVPIEKRGSFMSFNSSVRLLGSGCASYVSGLILIELPSGAFANFPTLGYCAIGITALSLILLLVWVKPHQAETVSNS